MAKPKRIMHKFRIDEISGVDVPAQEGARVTIMKRDDSGDESADESADEIEKYSDSQSRDDHGRFGSGGGGEGSKNLHDIASEHHAKMAAEHQKQMDKHNKAIQQLHGKLDLSGKTGMTPAAAKTIAQIGEHNVKYSDHQQAYEHHTNEAMHQARLAVGYTKSDDGSSADTLGKNDNGEDMELKELEQAVATLTKKLSDAEAYGALNDAERAHLSGLDGSDRESFLKMGRTDRSSQISKALESNPIVFTSAGGEAFRKNDDPRLVAMAKRNDELAKAASESSAREQDATFAKRAQDEMGNLPGESPVKVALIKALSTITDEAVRGKATQMLKAANASMSKAFQTLGTTQNSDGSGEGRAVDKLETMAKRYSEDRKVSIEKARVEVLNTPEGKTLYAETTAKGAGV